jgi:hypothetical protein
MGSAALKRFWHRSDKHAPTEPWTATPASVNVPRHALQFLAASLRTEYDGLKVPLRLLIEKNRIDLKTAMPVVRECFLSYEPKELIGKTRVIYSRSAPIWSVAVLHKTTQSIKVPHGIDLRTTGAVADCQWMVPLSNYRP